MHGGATLAKSLKPSSGTRCRSAEVFTVLGRSRKASEPKCRDAMRFDAGEAVVPEFVFSSQSGYRPQCELPLLSPRTTNVCGNVGEGVAIRGKR